MEVLSRLRLVEVPFLDMINAVYILTNITNKVKRTIVIIVCYRVIFHNLFFHRLTTLIVRHALHIGFLFVVFG